MSGATPRRTCRRDRFTNDGVDIIPLGYAWLDKEKLLPGQNWELEIRKAVCKMYN